MARLNGATVLLKKSQRIFFNFSAVLPCLNLARILFITVKKKAKFLLLLKVFSLIFYCLFFSGCGMLSTQMTPNPDIKSSDVVKTAYRQVGKKYRLGGASPQKGFDCSGLVWWSYNQHGIKLPRITLDQAKAGKSVPRRLAKPGDIVVFRTGQSPRGLHTGLYAGADSFIHSPGRGKTVCLDQLSAPHWKNKLVSVRRVFRN